MGLDTGDEGKVRMTPYYADDHVRLYCGDCREVLPTLANHDDPIVSCVTDPPYGETSAVWDRWPDGWVDAVAGVLPPSASLWCFGSARMFLDRRDDFAGWRLAQEMLWVKPRGSSPGTPDRLARVHEWAYHWYRGQWGKAHHEWPRQTWYGQRRRLRVGAKQVSHQGDWERASVWVDDGTRQQTSVVQVIEAPAVRQGRHQDEKPLAVTIPLVRECTPPGGVVVDPFAGAGTTGLAAKTVGRRAVLVEADEAMCETAARRLEQDQPLLCDETPLNGVAHNQQDLFGVE